VPIEADNMSVNARGHQELVPIADLAAGADLAAVAIFCAPRGGATLRYLGILPQGDSAGIDNANTAVLAFTDGAGNAVLTKTYNTANQPPAASVYADLGSISAVHGKLAANETLRVAITQGAAADLPALLLVVEWEPAHPG
jgi:hypothetical protein